MVVYGGPIRAMRRLFNAAGFDLVRTSGMHNLAAHLAEVLRRYQIDTGLDVGANQGQFDGELRQIGFRGQIHSFEPIRSVYELLTAAAACDPDWKTYRLAMGASLGRATINVSEST